uniref:Putative secreted protein n=1 Tax=Ixodes scapularis TaxID=6945 RepID=A0A4D5RAI1_IXOSC
MTTRRPSRRWSVCAWTCAACRRAWCWRRRSTSACRASSRCCTTRACSSKPSWRRAASCWPPPRTATCATLSRWRERSCSCRRSCARRSSASKMPSSRCARSMRCCA